MGVMAADFVIQPKVAPAKRFDLGFPLPGVEERPINERPGTRNAK